MVMLVPTARNRVYDMSMLEVPPEIAKQDEAKWESWTKRLTQMIRSATAVIRDKPDIAAPLEALSSKQLTLLVFKLDENQVQLDAIRNDITAELQRYETELDMAYRQREGERAELDPPATT
jgi:hypothetical protein